MSVIDELWVNRTVRRLDLSLAGPSLVDPLCLREICRALSHASSLRLSELDLSHSSIGDAGASTLAAMLEHNSTLRSLRLEGSAIGDDGMHALLGALKGRNCTLRSLLLHRKKAAAKGKGEALSIARKAVLAQIASQLRDNSAREALRAASVGEPRLLLTGHSLCSTHMGLLRNTLVDRLPTPAGLQSQATPSGTTSTSTNGSASGSGGEGTGGADADDAHRGSPGGSGGGGDGSNRPSPLKRRPSSSAMLRRVLVQTLDVSANSTCGDPICLSLVCRGPDASHGELLTDDLLARIPRLHAALRNPPDEPFARALARLHTLCLRRCSVTDAGAAALAAALHMRSLPSLRALDLRDNLLGTHGGGGLAESRTGGGSGGRGGSRGGGRDATMQHQQPSAETMRVSAAFGFACAFQTLQRLQLDHNPRLLDKPAHVLLRNLLQPTSSPARLSLYGCSIGDEACRAVATALLGGAQLLQLLIGDLVGDEGAGHLARAVRSERSALRELALGCEVGDAGVEALADAMRGVGAAESFRKRPGGGEGEGGGKGNGEREGSMSQAQLRALFEETDKDNNGMIDFSEFCHLFGELTDGLKAIKPGHGSGGGSRVMGGIEEGTVLASILDGAATLGAFDEVRMELVEVAATGGGLEEHAGIVSKLVSRTCPGVTGLAGQLVGWGGEEVARLKAYLEEHADPLDALGRRARREIPPAHNPFARRVLGDMVAAGLSAEEAGAVLYAMYRARQPGQAPRRAVEKAWEVLAKHAHRFAGGTQQILKLVRKSDAHASDKALGADECQRMLAIAAGPLLPESQLRAIFAAFDANLDGEISVDELHRVMRMLNPHHRLKELAKLQPPPKPTWQQEALHHAKVAAEPYFKKIERTIGNVQAAIDEANQAVITATGGGDAQGGDGGGGGGNVEGGDEGDGDGDGNHGGSNSQPGQSRAMARRGGLRRASKFLMAVGLDSGGPGAADDDDDGDGGGATRGRRKKRNSTFEGNQKLAEKWKKQAPGFSYG